MPDFLGIVLAGGEGKRLAPLTADRAKPAVPFGGNYRLIDFALSNLVNANYHQIVVLTQYKSHSLDRHVTTTWRLSPLLGNYVTPVPAQMRLGPRWFVGSADAIYQNYNLIADERPEHIIVFGGTVRRSVLSPLVHLHSYSLVEDSILMHGAEVARNAVVRRAILDKNVYIGEGVEIGVDADKDRERFHVSDGGVVVIPKGQRVL